MKSFIAASAGRRRGLVGWLGLVLGILMGTVGVEAMGWITLRDGYFWDTERSEYFLPRGVAYQTFNPEVGATQSPEQIAYDFEQIANLRANSVRCEFVWGQLEVRPGEYDWAKADRLIAEAERVGLRLFVIVGFQYPPSWFPAEWRAVNDRVLSDPGNEREWRSDVLNYEHPEARLVYSNHVARVTARYRDRRAIAGWILGNEYAYFDLWEDVAKYPNRRMLGHDPHSLTAFRAFLRERHGHDIANLNAAWGAAYAAFDDVPMPGFFPADRNSPAHLDAYQWRKRSIGDFVALGAQAARANDPNHLRTYSMVGGIYNGLDANFTAEDGRAIVRRCFEAGAPLDFWSINNYGWAQLGSEMRSGDFGIAKYKALTGLPVMISETGYSGTENLFDVGVSDKRQPRALESQLWEGFTSGAIGLHIFTWNDRLRYSEEYFYRERGFGFLTPERRPKPDVFERVGGFFRQMDNVRAERLFGGSREPRPDVQLFWSDDSDLGWSIANQENAMLWGALRRYGVRPGLMGDEDFQRRAYTNAPVLLVSRAFALRSEWRDALGDEVLAAGIHVHANADLPGQFTPWHRPNPGWASFMSRVFGLDVSQARAGADFWSTEGGRASLRFVGTAPPGVPTDTIWTWKIWHGLRATSGRTVVRHGGVEGSQGAMPALQVVDHGRSRAVVNTFAVGDLDVGGASRSRPWDIRVGWLRYIYGTEFGLRPAFEVEGEGADYVFKDYRLTRGGGVLVSLLNGDTNTARLTLGTSGSLLAGRRIERISRSGGVLEDIEGRVGIGLEPDECVVIYAYPRDDEADRSLVTPSPVKLAFAEAPGALVPGGPEAEVRLIAGAASEHVYLALEQEAPVRRTLQTRGPRATDASGAVRLEVSAPVAGDATYPPTERGGRYALQAWIEGAGGRLAGVRIPVRLLPGIEVWADGNLPGAVRVTWEGLPVLPPGGATPTVATIDWLARLEWWDSLALGTAAAAIRLEASNGLAPIFLGSHVTLLDGKERVFDVPGSVGANATVWEATAWEGAEYRSVDFFDSFEGRQAGARAKRLEEDPEAASYFAPWGSYSYGDPAPLWWDEGVHPEGSHGGQSAFLVYTNQPGAVNAGIGIQRSFPATWSLPSNRAEWRRYEVQFDFKERSGLPCVIEVQLASPGRPGDWSPRVLHFEKSYEPGMDGWDTLRATLDRLTEPAWSSGFDPSQIERLVCNVQLRAEDTMYLVSVDNVRLDGPDELVRAGRRLAAWSSAASLPADTDGDGLPDGVESGTGRYLGPTDTGTRPDRADTDGDGMSDGDEVLAGTDPNDAGDAVALSARVLPSGGVELRWRTRPGRAYELEVATRLGDGGGFVPVPDTVEFLGASGGPSERTFVDSIGVGAFYRLRVRPL